MVLNKLKTIIIMKNFFPAHLSHSFIQVTHNLYIVCWSCLGMSHKWNHIVWYFVFGFFHVVQYFFQVYMLYLLLLIHSFLFLINISL